MDIHDRGYKKLFSNHTIFRQLLETFVGEEWINEVDFSTCETIDKSFLSADYDQTTSDLIYKIKLRKQDIYVVVLTEFQPSVDRFMVLRVLNYITNFYMDYVYSQRKSKEAERGYKLPAIFPILLYNGEDSWTAPTKMSELIEPLPDLGDYGINFQYFKIAEDEFTKEELLKIWNIVSTLFLAESHYDIDLLQEELITLFNTESDKRAASLLINWFKQLWVHKRITTADYEKLDKVYRSEQEVRTMMMQAIEIEKKGFVEQGIEIGLEKGLVQARETLLMVINFRYQVGKEREILIQKQLQRITSLEILKHLTNLCLESEEFDKFNIKLEAMLVELASKESALKK